MVQRSHGRRSLPGILLGLPVVVLTTVGARSGAARSGPVVVLRSGEKLAALGTNFGQERRPAWSANLAAHPEAVITWRGRQWRVRARLATDAEAAAIWETAERAYRGFAAYRRRVTTRVIEVWVLEPEGDAS